MAINAGDGQRVSAENERIRVAFLLLLGLGIREAFSFWTAHPFDFEIWVRLGYYVSRGADPYVSTLPIPGLSIPGTGTLPSIAYPPFWAFMQALVYDLYSLLGYSNRFFYYFLLKQETIIPDILVGYLIYRIIAQRGNTEGAGRALAFWMVCPFVVIISAVWGMFDQLVLLAVLVSMLFARNTLTSAASEGLGIVLKAIPIIFLPVLTVRQSTKGSRLLFILLAPGLAVFLTLVPYLYFHSWSLSALLGAGSSAASVPSNSMNYWVIAYVVYGYSLLPSSLNQFVNGMGYVWILALVLAYVYTLRKTPRDGISIEYSILALQFITLVFFLTRIGIAEQYLTYFLGFGLLEQHTIGKARSRLFTGVWVSAMGYLLANNSYLLRFLSPLSAQFVGLDNTLSSGMLGVVRNGLMIVAALAFTAFCALYLRSLYSEIKSRRTSLQLTGALQG
jgi:hypothetical protein